MISEAMALLGLKSEDKVTGFRGVVSSVCFDLYGCVQVALSPEVGKDGKPGESFWFDIKRVKTGKRVMELPNFAGLKFGQESGPAERPKSMLQP